MADKKATITAPKASTMRKLILKKNAKVDTNVVIVNKKADQYYNGILTNYKNIQKYFNTIATEYRNCANKSVKGDKICASLKKVATDCENQGKYCQERAKWLKIAYKKDKSAKSVVDLENSVGTLNNHVSGSFSTWEKIN